MTAQQAKGKRVALYLRVSTDGQTTENQRRELEQAADRRGWQSVRVYEDAGISGAKGRDKRPGLDSMLKDAVRGRFDVLAVWSVDRIGRSLADLIASLHELHGAGVELYLHQQGVDTTTPAGKAMFQMLGVFAEFERSMIQARVKAGMARARAKGVVCGRPRVTADTEEQIRAALAEGTGILKIAKLLGVGTGTVQRVRAQLVSAA